MKARRNRRGNVEETVREDALWQDPMSYPVYDRKSLTERSVSVCEESENMSMDTAVGKVAA